MAARIISGGEQVVIGGSTAPDSYLVTGESGLTANGASTKEIRAETSSSVTLNDSVVTATGTLAAVGLVDSHADIVGSTLTSAGTGLSLSYNTINPLGSTATVVGSVISGGLTGALVGGPSVLTLDTTQLTATDANGAGLQMAGGQVTASQSNIRGGLNGVLVFSGDTAFPAASLVLDKSNVVGETGAAVVVDFLGVPADAFTIDVRNGSTLVGGNGVILDVRGGATANLLADNSDLVGDVIAKAGSTANVTLQNFATLTGRLENVDTLTLNSQGKWVMVEDGQLTNLVMGGGSVQFGQPGDFYTLSVENLSGNGNFIMHTNFASGQTDFLNVTGTATGSHTLDVASSGADPLSDKQIHVVHSASGDASFSLLNGRVDLGTYSYDLLQVGANDWYLDAASKIISPGTDSILSLFDASRTVWYGELSTLRGRMGEVRMNSGQTGGWMRAYGNRYDVSANSGMAYKQDQQGLSFGVDTPLPSVGDGQWVFGLLGGYSHSNLDMKYGTTGEVDSFYIGSYATWLDAESGYYFDGVLKLNRFQNESNVSLSDGTRAKGSYNTNGLGTTLEFGRHIKLDDGYFVEPYVQAAALAVQGKSYSLDNGMSADGNQSRSLLGTVGSTVGRDIDLGGGQILQPYLKAALVHEFAKDNEVRVNSTTFNNDLSGSRLALGGGAAMKVNDKVQMHADLDYSHSSKIKQPWGVNIGVEYKW
ncbi:autotransporter outer membrane beta-barrel domain-containing protein [Pseudomonas sp. MWU13-2105]|uniref:autotransporter outer membrane beta-barrel domain-containing protein n=1 Tax=Pseudomonas sp. MWU13-2105 TaxID=2935074 RepID=UPI00298C2937|nr:autotransporter outer membrane beta-barrel domain-containing protein [Pseudomonas sp. MWU13-2105]